MTSDNSQTAANFNLLDQERLTLPVWWPTSGHTYCGGGSIITNMGITYYCGCHVCCKMISIDVSPDDKFISAPADAELTPFYPPSVEQNKGPSLFMGSHRGHGLYSSGEPQHPNSLHLQIKWHFDDSPLLFAHQTNPVIKWRVIFAICQWIINFIPTHCLQGCAGKKSPIWPLYTWIVEMN